MSNVIWLAVIVALAALGVAMAFAGTRASRPHRKPSRLACARALYRLKEAMGEAQQDSSEKGQAS